MNSCFRFFKWLNTCVGAKNYNYFLGAIFSVCTFTTISLALSLAFLVEVFAFEAAILGRLQRSGEEVYMGAVGVKVITVLSVTVLLPVVGLVYQLVGFHCMLLWNNITTYEFIVQEQKRQRDKENEKLEVVRKAVAKKVQEKKESNTTHNPAPTALAEHSPALSRPGKSSSGNFDIISNSVPGSKDMSHDNALQLELRDTPATAVNRDSGNSHQYESLSSESLDGSMVTVTVFGGGEGEEGLTGGGGRGRHEAIKGVVV